MVIRPARFGQCPPLSETIFLFMRSADNSSQKTGKPAKKRAVKAAGPPGRCDIQAGQIQASVAVNRHTMTLHLLMSNV